MRTIQEELFFDYFTNRLLKSAQTKIYPLTSLRRRLLQLWEQRVLHVEFVDEWIFSHADELMELLDDLQKEGIGFLFSFTCPVYTLVKNQKYLTPLKKVGLRKITLQVINANLDVLAGYGVKASSADQVYAIQILKALGIHLHIHYTMFEPRTTVEQLARGMEFLQENRLLGLAPYRDILLSYLDHQGAGQAYLKDGEEELFQPAADPELPYQIFDQEVERLFKWMLFYHGEFGEQWDQFHESLLELRKELAKKRPNWIVTNPGQELMHLTLQLRTIPYNLFQALLKTAQKGQIQGVRADQVQHQCQQYFSKFEKNYLDYRKYHDF